MLYTSAHPEKSSPFPPIEHGVTSILDDGISSTRNRSLNPMRSVDQASNIAKILPPLLISFHFSPGTTTYIQNSTHSLQSWFIITINSRKVNLKEISTFLLSPCHPVDSRLSEKTWSSTLDLCKKHTEGRILLFPVTNFILTAKHREISVLISSQNDKTSFERFFFQSGWV